MAAALLLLLHLLLLLQPQPEELLGSWPGVGAGDQLPGQCLPAVSAPLSTLQPPLYNSAVPTHPSAVSKILGAVRAGGTDLKSWEKWNSLYCVSR